MKNYNITINIPLKGKDMIIVHVNGQLYNHQQLASLLGLNYQFLCRKCNEMRATPNKLILWMKKKLWLKEHNFRSTTKVYHQDDYFTSTHLIAEQAEISHSTAKRRRDLFDAGKISKEELLQRGTSQTIKKEAAWEGLSICNSNRNKKRINSINKLSKPTKFDKQLKDYHSISNYTYAKNPLRH